MIFSKIRNSEMTISKQTGKTNHKRLIFAPTENEIMII